jgi:hypothetical protein
VTPVRLVLCLLLLACASSSASAEEVGTFTSGRFVFHHAPGYEALARALAAKAEPESQRIARALGLALPDSADVALLPRKSGLSPQDFGFPAGPEWASGLATTNRSLIVLRTSDDGAGGGGALVTTFRHELVHLITSQALGPRQAELPAWLKEGTATTLAFEWKLAESARSLRLALGGGLKPLAELRHGFPADAEAARDAYVQSFSFVSWLLDRYGPGPLRQLYRGVAEGAQFDLAFFSAYGATSSQLEKLWRKRFMKQYAWLPIITSASMPWAIMVVLFLAGTARKRRNSKRKLAQWEKEEAQERLALERLARQAESADGDLPQ